MIAAVVDAHRKAVDAAVAAERIADMWPEQSGKLADRIDFIARLAETVPSASPHYTASSTLRR